MNNRQYQNRRRGQAPTPNQTAAKAGKKLPYGFVKVEKIKDGQRLEAVDLSKNDPGSLYTGYLSCTLYAMNELCVGNSHEDLGGDCTLIKPLEVNNRILISASTLKGCISNFVAALLQLPISRMNNKRYSFRPNNAFALGGKINFGAGLVTAVHDDGSLEIQKFKENKFVYSREHRKDGVYSYDPNRSAFKYILAKYGHQEGFFKFYPYHDGIDGKGTLGIAFNGKSSHKSFGVKTAGRGAEPEFEDQVYHASSETYRLFSETQSEVLANEKTGHFSDHPMSENIKGRMPSILRNIRESRNIKVGDLIFFEYKKDSQEILTFGRHFRYRWAYSRSLHDFEEDYQAYDKEAIKQGKVNLVEEMFGYSYEDKDIPYRFRSKSGKVHFSYAVHEPETGSLKAEKWLPRPGSPKPSSYEFYLRQDENSRKPMRTYGDPVREDFEKNPRLSGRKMYYKTQNTSFGNLKQGDEEATVKLINVLHPEKGNHPTFKFKVHFENLTISELNLLYFSLCLGQNKTPDKMDAKELDEMLCHQLGYGKNHGMGAVKIIIDPETVFSLKYDPETKTIRPAYLKYKNLPTRNIPPELEEMLKIRNEERNYPSDSRGIHSWHTRLKNDDLKKRRE